MTTLLDKQRSATSKVPGPDETTLDQVLSRIAGKLAAAAAGAGSSRRGAARGSASAQLRYAGSRGTRAPLM
jgi:hypothetical protein